MHERETVNPGEPCRDLQPVGKLATGIEGFDNLSIGGIPEGRTTVVAGSAGSGKTVFSLEFAWRSLIQFERNVVFVTCEERSTDIIRNVKRMGWDLAGMIEQGRLIVIDASPPPTPQPESGGYDLSGLMTQLLFAVDKCQASVIVLDSLGALFSQFTDNQMLRLELFRISDELKRRGITSLFTAERLEEYGQVSRHGVEEFVSDNVIVLRGVLHDERYRRTMQILKFRGDTHHKGEYPFTITTDGISIYPLAAMELKQHACIERIGSGNDKLDEMCGGGLYADSIILASGATGTGKTLLANTFVAAACRANQRVIVFAFEESREQLLRNAASWGMDFRQWEEAGLLRIVCRYPESAGLEEHLLTIRNEVIAFNPERAVIDSISAMGRVSTDKIFREFVIGATSYFKENRICGFFTSTTPKLSGGESITEAHISTITDSIIMLRYVEIDGALRRGIAVIKMRGSQHDKEVREYSIDGHGIKINGLFDGVQNILLGIPSCTPKSERERLADMFQEP